MKQVTAAELKELMDKNIDFQLIDVREQYEYDESNLNGLLIPMGEVMSRLGEIARDKQVVIHCRSGARSASIINALEQQGFSNLFNLQGGIIAFHQQFGQ